MDNNTPPVILQGCPELKRRVISLLPKESQQQPDIAEVVSPLILTILRTLIILDNPAFMETVVAESSGGKMLYSTQHGYIDFPVFISKVIESLVAEGTGDEVDDESLTGVPPKMDFFAQALIGLVRHHPPNKGDRESLRSTFLRLRTAASKNHHRNLTQGTMDSIMTVLTPHFTATEDQQQTPSTPLGEKK
jgi:hypothetical protein